MKFWTQPSTATILLEIKCSLCSNNRKTNDHVLNFSSLLRLRSALFWDITQHKVVMPYRRFGTTHRSHHKVTPWLLKMGPIVFSLKRRYGIMHLFCVIFHKTADLIYIAAEAWNHVSLHFIFAVPVPIVFGNTVLKNKKYGFMCFQKHKKHQLSKLFKKLKSTRPTLIRIQTWRYYVQRCTLM